jgi:hypothetical protein
MVEMMLGLPTWGGFEGSEKAAHCGRYDALRFSSASQLRTMAYPY